MYIYILIFAYYTITFFFLHICGSYTAYDIYLYVCVCVLYAFPERQNKHSCSILIQHIHVHVYIFACTSIIIFISANTNTSFINNILCLLHLSCLMQKSSQTRFMKYIQVDIHTCTSTSTCSE